jgi:diketogulonate reductase-like aldo/keto reductase
VYRNEADLGQSFETLLPKYNLKREDIFIITKIGKTKSPYRRLEKVTITIYKIKLFPKATYNQGEKCTESIKKSLENLKTTYLDLVLIHWPGVKGVKLDDPLNGELRRVTYQQLEDLHAAGSLRLIGVSNYNLGHLDELLSYARIRPHLLQVMEKRTRLFMNI